MDHHGRNIWQSLVLLLVASGNWVYDWPYGARGECRCKSIEALTGGGYADANSCVMAFSEEEYEYCWATNTEGERIGGITESDCGMYAVSTHPAFTNMDCEVACLKVLVGGLSEARFLQHCKIESVVKIRNKVSTLKSGCFVNYVLGHADYNPSLATNVDLRPLKIFPEVRTAGKCQSLCQQLGDCAWFQWRAVADDECNTPSLLSFQRPPRTCELYSYSYVQTVLGFHVGFFGASSSAYAGGVCDIQQLKDRGCTDLFKTSSWNPFGVHTACLNCGCEQKCAFAAKTHVSGPAFCDRGELTDVCTMRPPFNHTSTPAPECSTSDCHSITTSAYDDTTTNVQTTAVNPSSTFTTYTTTQNEGTSTSTTDMSRTTTDFHTIETTTGLHTRESTTALQTSSFTKSERPCGPCPPCTCPPDEPHCHCECSPCPCEGDGCSDAQWEAQDFVI